jgi:hypothetical protein
MNRACSRGRGVLGCCPVTHLPATVDLVAEPPVLDAERRGVAVRNEQSALPEPAGSYCRSAIPAQVALQLGNVYLGTRRTGSWAPTGSDAFFYACLSLRSDRHRCATVTGLAGQPRRSGATLATAADDRCSRLLISGYRVRDSICHVDFNNPGQGWRGGAAVARRGTCRLLRPSSRRRSQPSPCSRRPGAAS